MTKIISYKCNLCGQPAKADKVVGIHHGTADIEPRAAVQCEAHLCAGCIMGLAAKIDVMKDLIPIVPKAEKAEK